jgi:uncharacterized OB-fold protein
MAGREYKLPIPVADEESGPFYRGARERKLMLLRCSDCGTWRMPGRERCIDCWSTESEWAQASGRGKLYSFGIMHQQYHPAFAEALPYNFAIVELAEGPRMISNIVDCASDALRIDMPLEAVYDDVSEETTLVRFRPRTLSP